MAATRKTTKPTTPADNEPVKADNEPETDPLQDAINAIPEEIESGTFPYMLAERMASGMVDYAKYSDIILRNTPSEEGLKRYAETSDSPDIVKRRDAVKATETEIAKLQAEIEAKRTELGRQVDALNEAAREEMNANLDAEARIKAKADREKVGTAITTYVRTFKVEMPDWDEHESVNEWLTDITKTVNGAGRFTSANTDPRNAAYNARVREWAKNNGVKVSERGRIADATYLAYVNATGDRKPQ